MSELSLAIQRLEATHGLDRQITVIVNGSDLRTVLAEAKRPPLSDAIRLRLIEVVEASPCFQEYDGPGLADAILAEFRPVANTRERLIEAIGRDWFPENWDAFRVDTDEAEAVASTVDGIIASGVLDDRAEVERAASEKAWDELWSSQFDGAPFVDPASLRDPNNPYRAAATEEGRS